MDQSLYYTFSTIAQTLGGAIALLGAFVFYRLQFLNAAIAHVVTQQIFQHIDGENHLAFEQLHAQGKHADLVERARSLPTSVATDHLQRPLTRLEELVAEKSSLLVRFRYSLILTVDVTALSATILALVPIVVSRCFAAPVLIVGLLAFVGCLATYAWLLLGDLT